MKFIFLLTMIFSCISVSFSQNDEEDYEQQRIEDSIKVIQFLTQVDHIELCELGLTCYTDSAYVDDRNERKLVQRCFLQGAIGAAGVDSSKIKKRQIAKNMDAFFQVLIQSTRNKTYIGGACYQPRNGILFFDKENQFMAYLEICFECHEINGIHNFGLSGFTWEQYEELECLFDQNSLKTQ